MRWPLLILGAVVGYLALSRTRKVTVPPMTTAWLNEQEQQAIRRSVQIDSVNWKWPVDKGAA
jgi:hypothetical protein